MRPLLSSLAVAPQQMLTDRSVCLCRSSMPTLGKFLVVLCLLFVLQGDVAAAGPLTYAGCQAASAAICSYTGGFFTPCQSRCQWSDTMIRVHGSLRAVCALCTINWLGYAKCQFFCSKVIFLTMLP